MAEGKPPYRRIARPAADSPRSDAGQDVTADFLGSAAKPAPGSAGGTPVEKPASPAAETPVGRAPMSVTALVTQVKRALFQAFPQRLCVAGEISNLKMHTSGHVYFSLKDAGATISAAMFRSAAAKLKFRPADGLEVVVEGRVDVYDARGQLQFYVESMTPKGAGALELAFRQLCQKLRDEGLFDPAHKRPLPRYPRAIGLVTSPTGAAIRDIRRTLARRWPGATVYLVPALVQGEGAAASVASAIGLLDANASRYAIDTIIVARGGGSLEDLWAFNEEVVARAVFACRTPIVSGVGHETDTTICDMVADVRAATPTAAAELAVPDRAEVARQLAVLVGRLSRRTQHGLATSRNALESVLRSVVFRDPAFRLRSATQRLDDLMHRLRASLRDRLTRERRRLDPVAHRLAALHPARLKERAAGNLDKLLARFRWALGGRSKKSSDRLEGLSARLLAANPRHRIAQGRSAIDHVLSRLSWAFGGRSKRAGDALAALEARLSAAHPRNRLALAQQKVEAMVRQLESMSYRSVLNRGFSVTRKPNGAIVRAAGEVAAGQAIETELASGWLRSIVEGQGQPPAEKAKPAPRKKADKEDDAPSLF